MNRTYCGSVDNKAINNNLVVNGWVNTRRDHGGVIFIDLRDHTGILQVVFNPDNKKVFEQAQNLRTEYVLEIKGNIKLTPIRVNIRLLNREIVSLHKKNFTTK